MRDDRWELNNIVAEIELMNEKVKLTLNDLNDSYFGCSNPSALFLIYYYTSAHIRTMIVLDYIDQLELKISKLKRIVEEKE